MKIRKFQLSVRTHWAQKRKSHVPTLSGVGHGTFYAEKFCCSAGKMGIDKDRMVLYNRSK